MSKTLKHLGVLLLFAGITVAFTRPLYQYLDNGFPYTATPTAGNEVVPFQQSDSVQQYYHFWMAWDYLNGGPGPFFRDPYEFKMEPGSEKLFTTRRLLASVLYVALAPLGTVVGFNLFLMLTLFLSCYFAFLLAKHYTSQFAPSLVAGVIFGLGPFALAQLFGGHTNGYLNWIIPFMILCFEKGLKTNKAIYYLFTAFGFCCFAFIEYHMLYFMALFFPPYFVWRMAFNWPGKKPFIKSVVCLGIAVLMGAAVMFFVKSFEIDSSIRSSSRSFAEVMLYTAPVQNFYVKDFSEMEKIIYIGFPALGAAAFSFLLFGWRRSLYWLYLGVTVLFGLLVLGPGQDTVPLYQWFHDYLPYFGYSRVPGRMTIFVMLGVSMLVALGLSRFKKFSPFLSLLLFGVIVWDYNPTRPVGITLLPPNSEVYEHVEREINNQNVLCLPIWPGESSWASYYLYEITKHRFPMVNGYYPVVPTRYVEDAFYPLYSVNVGELSQTQWELLKKFDVKFVVLHEEAFPRKVSNFPATLTLEYLMHSPYLKYIKQSGPHILFEVLETPRKVEPKNIFSDMGNVLTQRHFRKNENYLVKKGFQVLAPGRYTLEIRLTGTGNEKIPVRLIGRDPQKRENHEYIDLAVIKETVCQPGLTQIDFETKRGLLVEVEIDLPRQTGIEVQHLLIRYQQSVEAPLALEAEEMFFKGAIVEDAFASGQKAVYAAPKTVAFQEMVFGPYREYPAGEYEAVFWMKAVDILPYLRRENPSLVQIDVVSNFGQETLARQGVLAEELYQNSYFPITLSFSLNEPKVLEFRAKYLRKTPIYIDRIDVKQK